MKKYQVLFSKVAAKELRALPSNELKRVFAKSKELEDEPRPAGCKKLVGEKENLWRVRVGDYRVIYSIDDTILIVDSGGWDIGKTFTTPNQVTIKHG